MQPIRVICFAFLCPFAMLATAWAAFWTWILCGDVWKRSNSPAYKIIVGPAEWVMWLFLYFFENEE